MEYLTHYPMPMGNFGKNPFGENLWRIISAPSRRQFLAGNEEPRYPEIGAKWILEKWLSAVEYAGTPLDWQARCSILGPYPSRGEYEMVWTFDEVAIEDFNVEKLIRWIEAGRNKSFVENRTACKDEYARQQNAVRSEQYARIYDKLPPYCNFPMVGYGGGRGTKTAPLTKTAEELGMPTGPNKFLTFPSRG